MSKYWDILKKTLGIGVLSLALIQCSTEITGTDEENTALKKGRGGQPASPITASSIVNSSFAAELAFDGDQNTRWESQAADPQWIKKDLGSGQPIQEIQLDWAAS
ncbi:MAG: discoidin domain-containing protein, partial [Fibrobacterales bacterium]